jgi:hypothetical protein
VSLETARDALGKAGRFLAACQVEFDASLTASDDELTAALEANDYPVHDAVRAFEADFGGLIVPVEDSETWRDDGMYVLIGAFSCVTSEAHVHPVGGPTQGELQLVPVAYTDNDCILFLDREGRAYSQDTIGDVDAQLVAENGRAAIAKMLENLHRARGD